MATPKNLTALMILLVVPVALLPKATLAKVKNPNCEKGIRSDCGAGFFQFIFLANTFTPSNECCHELLKVGKNCHNQFVELSVSTHKPIKGTISDVYRRSNETWNNCVAALGPVSSPEPAH